MQRDISPLISSRPRYGDRISRHFNTDCFSELTKSMIDLSSRHPAAEIAKRMATFRENYYAINLAIIALNKRIKGHDEAAEKFEKDGCRDEATIHSNAAKEERAKLKEQQDLLSQYVNLTY